MATQRTKCDIAQSLFIMIHSHVEEGTISRAEAEEVVTVLGDCIRETNQDFIKRGKKGFITKAKPIDNLPDMPGDPE